MTAYRSCVNMRTRKIGIDDGEAQRKSYLRAGKAYTFACVHGGKHGFDGFSEVGTIERYGLTFFAEHGVAVEVDRETHFSIEF